MELSTSPTQRTVQFPGTNLAMDCSRVTSGPQLTFSLYTLVSTVRVWITPQLFVLSCTLFVKNVKSEDTGRAPSAANPSFSRSTCSGVWLHNYMATRTFKFQICVSGLGAGFLVEERFMMFKCVFDFEIYF